MSVFVWGVLQVGLIIISPFLYIALGELMLWGGRLLAARFCGIFPSQALAAASSPEVPETSASLSSPLGWPKAQLLLLGLLGYLAVAFILWHIALPIAWASLLPFLGLAARPRRFVRILGEVTIAPHLNFFIWFVVVFILGLSLFRATNGIQTPWVNNYGDLTFHLGQICSFVFGENSLPEYQIFAGERLSYPFFINFWSATLWWVNPHFISLLWIFTFQWTVCWCLLYYFLNGNRYWMLPWAVLLGGGTYSHMAIVNSGELISHNLPWTAFITTIWVTQRSALFGACVLAGVLQLFHTAEHTAYSRDWRRYAAIGGILALMPLVHSHFFLVGVLYIGIVLLAQAVREGLGEILRDPWRVSLVPFILGLLPTLIWFPWIHGKESMVRSTLGWVSGDWQSAQSPLWSLVQPWLSLSAQTSESARRFLAAMDTWFSLSTATCWLALIVIFWIVARRHVSLLTVVLLLVVGQFVQLAEWDWDQIKYFIGIYIVFISLWAWSSARWLFAIHFLAIYLIVPATYEVWTIWDIRSAIERLFPATPGSSAKRITPTYQYTVYESGALDIAEGIRQRTVAGDVIVAAPDHNSPATISGRRMFYGYEGTLNSHLLPYQSRRELMIDFDKLIHCSESTLVAPALCPRYLLWTPAEQRYFKRSSPPDENFEKTEVPYLFRFR